MSTAFSAKSKRLCKQAGIALITTLMLMFLMSTLLVGFTVLLISNQQLAGSNNDDVDAFYGAEAGMEKLTADLGNLFSQTYSPSISQVNALETTPPTIPGVSFLTGSGSSGYLIQPQSLDGNGNPAPVISTIKSGPYVGMTAMVTDYTLTVNARTAAGREVRLLRTTETVGIPMFQFAVFCDVDCAFHAGQNFTLGGRVHGNGNLFLGAASGTTLQMQGKVDAYKDIIRAYMDNGVGTSGQWPGTVSVTTNPGGGTYRNLALGEGSDNNGTCITGWTNLSTGSSPTNYASNLIDGQGSVCKQFSTGAKLLNLGIVTIGGNSTQPIDLIRRPVGGENANVTGERYFAQASLQILLSDNPQDIMNLPCVEQSTQPLDLSVLAQPVALWPATAPYSTLKAKMTTYGTTPLPLAASGSNTGGYNSTDGYWLPPNYPIIKGFIKVSAQTAYGSPCGTWQDVTAEILALGYVGKNINPVSQSLDGATMNPQWPLVGSGTCTSTTSCNQMDPLQGTTHYTLNPFNGVPPNELATINAAYTYGIPNPPTAEVSAQSSAAIAAGNFTGQNITGSGSCLDPHPNAVIRLERIRDNPSSLYAAHYKVGASWINYVASGIYNNPGNLPKVAPVAVVCGVDPTTGKLPVIADINGSTATWTPQTFDFWPNTLFDTREGTLRDVTPGAPYANLPTLNGTMQYVELDVANLAKWFAGTIGTTGASTKDPIIAPNDFSVYFSDRRGNYSSTTTWTGWPPVSPMGHETGEYGWTDFANGGDAANGCPNNTLDAGEDLDGVNRQYTYGVNSTDTNYIMGNGSATLAENAIYNISAGAITGNLTTTYGQYGFYTVTQLTTGAAPAIKANPSCGAPAYTNGIWPMMYAGLSNAARENPSLFFRRALKLTDAKNLTTLGTCPATTTCGLAVASENPVYIHGDYNANSAGGGFNDPSVGASIAADAATILSNNWNDVNSFSYMEYSIGGAPRNPSPTYYRTAIIGGKGVSFPNFAGSADNGTDGGVHNFLRYLEDWGGGSVNYLGALVNLYTNRQANGIFKCCTDVYSVPNRVYSFDTNFLTPSSLPPRTPLFRDVDTTGWSRLQLASQN